MVDLSSVGSIFNSVTGGPSSGDSGGGIADLIKDLAPTVLSGAQYLTAKDSIKDQSSTVSQALKDSAARLNTGYDEKQGYTEQGIDELIKILSGGLTDVTGQQRNAGFDYGTDTRENVNKYASYIQPLVDQLTQGLSGAGDVYSLQLDKASNAAENALSEGSSGFEQKLSPYTTAGNEALGYLQQVMGIDPNQLTPEQRIQMDDYTRELMANLSASGLRGAGRAGVAAVGDSQGRLRAQLFKQNQDRADHAAELLNQQGYGATTNVANNLNTLKKDIADLRYKTGTSKASTGLDLNKAIASAAYGAGQDVAGKMYAGDTDVAKTTYNINKGVGDLTGQFYKDLGNLTSDRYTSRGNTALGKAQVDSSAGLNQAANSVNANQANQNLTSSTLDKIGTMITSNNSTAAKDWRV